MANKYPHVVKYLINKKFMNCALERTETLINFSKWIDFLATSLPFARSIEFQVVLWDRMYLNYCTSLYNRNLLIKYDF